MDKPLRDRLVLTLLGGFHARFESGAPLPLPTHKYRALLAYLALPPGRAHPRDKLVALLWDDLPRAQGRTRLRQAVLALRRALGGSATAALAIEADTIALRARAVTVDAVELQGIPATDDLEALEGAAALYGGDLLAGLPVRAEPFEEWLAAERARLADLALQLLFRLLCRQRDAGALDKAVQVAHRLLALDPLQESAHRALMELYRRLGRRPDALRQYQACLDALARELGTEPAPETRRLYVDILREQTAPLATQVGTGPATAWIRAAGTGPLVGRDTERQQLRGALRSAMAGAGSVVVVTGEAGMGKSRLVAEVAGQAVLGGSDVLVGQCHETDQILACGPWAEALRQLDAGRIIALAEELAAPQRSELGRLLPQLAHGGARSSGEALPLFDAVAMLLFRLSAARPIVLIVEDLHWADEMSIRLLAHLSRRMNGWNLLLLATVREEDLDDVPFVRRSLDALAASPRCTTVDLQPLSRGDTEALVRALARGNAAARGEQLEQDVWRLSEGHPFTVVELLRMVCDGATPGPGRMTELPRRVRQAVTFRLERMGDRARRLVDVAAVLGRQFDIELLALAADVDTEVAIEGLEELVRRRVVESVGDEFRFVHHWVREAARPLLPPRRARLHRRVAEAIEQRHAADVEAHLGALAHHYEQAGVWDRAAAYLQRTGDLARRRGAYRESLVSYERALAAASHLPPGRATLEQQIDLRLGMRYALSPLGEVTRAIDCVEPARKIAEALGDRRRLARAELFLSEGWRWQGHYARAAEASRRAHVLALELEDSDLSLFAAVFLAAAHAAQGLHGDAIRLLEDAVFAVGRDDPGATLLSRPAVAAAACGWLARSLAIRGERERVRPLLGESMAHAEVVGSPHAMAVACALAGEVRLLLDEPADALIVLERGLDLCRRAEIRHRLAMLEAATGYARALSGRLAEGAAQLEAAIARADAERQLWFQPQRLAWLADVQSRAGQAAAAETAARALALARRIGEKDSEALALRVHPGAA